MRLVDRVNGTIIEAKLSHLDFIVQESNYQQTCGIALRNAATGNWGAVRVHEGDSRDKILRSLRFLEKWHEFPPTDGEYRGVRPGDTIDGSEVAL